MKLLDTTIYGFGKFYQKTFSFQDGIHVIYGPNETGKSTLHTFLGCMLFGLERGRGRAAKGDLYSRCLPWDHDATYGGTLSFEKDDQIYQIQRNFRADRRSCQLTVPGHMPVNVDDSLLADEYYEGLTESLYYNTISVRSLGCAPDGSLAEAVSRQLTDLQQTGTDSIDYSAAAAWLRAERKRHEALLTTDLEQQILQKKQTLSQWEQRLENASFQERKAALEMDMDDCMEELAALVPLHDDGPELPAVPAPILPRLLTLFLFLTAILLWICRFPQGAVAAGIASLLLLLFSWFRSRRDQRRSFQEGEKGVDDSSSFRDEELSHGFPEAHPPIDDPRAFRLRERMQSLQKQYKTVCRQEWDHDRLLEQYQLLEEELEQLTARHAQEEDIRQEIQAITLAAATLQKLSSQLQDTVGPQLSHSMSRILAGLTGGAYTQVFVDGQLHISVRTVSRTVPLESLSRGTIEQIYLAMRLAVIDLLFPKGGMPLLLDDCFLAYDDMRLTQTLLWLAENYSGQVLIFTCQTREASLLQKEKIPFTYINLQNL